MNSKTSRFAFLAICVLAAYWAPGCRESAMPGDSRPEAAPDAVQSTSVADIVWRPLLVPHLPDGFTEATLDQLLRHYYLEETVMRADAAWEGEIVWRSTGRCHVVSGPGGEFRASSVPASSPTDCGDVFQTPPNAPAELAQLRQWLADDAQRALSITVLPSGTQESLPLATYAGLALGKGGIVEAKLGTPNDAGISILKLRSEGDRYAVVFECDASGTVSQVISIAGLAPKAFLAQIAERLK